jgi:spore maturation protein B
MFSGKQNRFALFAEGAKDGLAVSVRLLPGMIALLTALSMLSASGAPALLAEALKPFFSAAGIPGEILPLILTRPVSGSASVATVADLIKRLGPDSFPSLCAAVMMSSSDTAVYVVSVYFSAVHVRRSRHALPVALTASFFCAVLACLLCRFFFG